MLPGMTTTSPSRPLAPDIPALLAQWEHSNLSIAAFAREHGIAPWKLYQARSANKPGSSSERSGSLLRVRVVDEPAAQRFVELILADGLRLAVYPGFDEQHLRRLVEVLGTC